MQWLLFPFPLHQLLIVSLVLVLQLLGLLCNSCRMVIIETTYCSYPSEVLLSFIGY